jgi:hypothetical protein
MQASLNMIAINKIQLQLQRIKSVELMDDVCTTPLARGHSYYLNSANTGHNSEHVRHTSNNRRKFKKRHPDKGGGE